MAENVLGLLFEINADPRRAEAGSPAASALSAAALALPIQQFTETLNQNAQAVAAWQSAVSTHIGTAQVALGDFQEAAAGGLEAFSEAMGKNAANAIVFGANIGEAMERALKATLASIASEALVRAIFETAQGLAALARWDFASAELHFQAAAIFGLIGGATAALGAAIPGGGASRGGIGAGVRGAGAAGTLPSAGVATPAQLQQGPAINVFIEGVISADNLSDVIQQISRGQQSGTLAPLVSTTSLQPATSRI